MARKSRSLLGIELQEHEIRVVEIRHGGPKPMVSVAGIAPMPTGALQEGVVVRADAVALSLQRLLDSLQVSTREAVLGVPANGVTVRALNLPPAPDSELGILVDGEVRHFQVVRSQGGAYGFFRLATAGGAADPTQPSSVLLMGAEEPVVAGLRDVAVRAGLSVVALEPSHMGLFRASAAQIPPTGTTMVVTMSDWRSDIIVLCEGQICVYRRIDIGFQNVLRRRQKTFDDHKVDDAPHEDVILKVPEPEAESSLVESVANNLAIEVRRSVEYFAREFATSQAIERVILAGNDPEVDELLSWLSNAVHLDVELASPKDPLASSKEVALELQPPGGVRYTAAYGFAMRDAETLPVEVPRVDLFVHQRTVAEMEVKRRSLAGALIGSILAILLGIGVAYGIGLQANNVEHEVGHLTDHLAGLEATNKRSADAEVTKMERLQLLSQEGVPVTPIMDAVAGSLPAEVGLTQVRLAPGGFLELSGETTTEAGVIQLQENLQRTQLISNVSVSNFERSPTSSGLTFRMSSQTITGTSSQSSSKGEVAKQ